MIAPLLVRTLGIKKMRSNLPFFGSRFGSYGLNPLSTLAKNCRSASLTDAPTTFSSITKNTSSMQFRDYILTLIQCGMWGKTAPNTPPHILFNVNDTQKQLTTLYPFLSDHRAFIVDDTLILNMMMQGKVKIVDGKEVYNNGHKVTEDDETYRKRLYHQMSTIGQILKNNPNVNKIAFQEAPLRKDIDTIADFFEKYLPEWHVATFDMTDFSVMSIVRRPENQREFFTDTINYGTYSDRCHTFTNGSSKWSNLHATHGTKEDKKTEECLTTIFRTMIEDMLNGNMNQHDVAGDFNSNHEEIQAILKKVWDELHQKRSSDQAKRYQLTCDFVRSPNGHQKADGTLVDADGYLAMKITPSDNYRFKFNAQRSGALFALLMGSTAILTQDAAMLDETIVTGTAATATTRYLSF